MSIPTIWGNQYASRQTSKYSGEHERFPFDESAKATFIDSLFKLKPYSLGPPPKLSHIHLRDILKDACINRPSRSVQSPAKPQDKIYIDDRRSNLDEAVAGELRGKMDWTGHLGKHEILDVPSYYTYVSKTEV
jgi:hypothetical protein